jgi:DNA-binding PadR family transcriptional regulator
MEGSTVEFVLLGLLHQGPRSGYDLRRILASSPLRHFSSSPGAIYPALGRLAGRKWVAVGPPGGSRRRQEFRLTARGRQSFLEWLRRPVTRDDVVIRPGDLLLRCAFMDGALPSAAIRRFLNNYAAGHGAYLEDLRRYEAEHADKMSTLGRLVFQHGVASYAGSVQWAKRALEVLDGSSETTEQRSGKRRGR